MALQEHGHHGGHAHVQDMAHDVSERGAQHEGEAGAHCWRTIWLKQPLDSAHRVHFLHRAGGQRLGVQLPPLLRLEWLLQPAAIAALSRIL